MRDAQWHRWVLGIAVLTAFGCGGPPDAPAGDPGAEGPLPTASGDGTVLRLDPRFAELVSPGALIEQVADGFEFLEGPVWIREEERLVFSDLGGNAIYSWTEDAGAEVLIAPYFEGDTGGPGPRRASNGITRDSEGRLVVGDHGRRQITRIEDDGTLTALADRYEGARLNSPNDLVYRSDGWLYFTDPPYGLDGQDDSPEKELDFNGIYRLSPTGELELLSAGQTRPNGIAFSPDESTLYVANCEADAPLWMAYDVGADGLSAARVFADLTGQEGSGCPDGLKVDLGGNVFATGPGGVWVFAPDGTPLGRISPDEVPANVGWGEDGRTLYMTARTGLYRIRVITEGRIL
ncbi:MAG: SMP-30/gluconolactonase/LRE family protein [Gammaproteobacteria bacterium]|nr:SMP-30/gluconolactonase/LRE family protein [Gammaproteobacteria bacterium]MDE0248385.1 SMP-30/gluconolactonase/LRE family protein [Gammaproteobacteria bacterium]